MNLYFRFRSGTSAAARTRTLRTLRAGGALTVTRLFPRTSTTHLKDHYVLEASGTADTQRLTKLLRATKEVAYVHGETRRTST